MYASEKEKHIAELNNFLRELNSPQTLICEKLKIFNNIDNYLAKNRELWMEYSKMHILAQKEKNDNGVLFACIANSLYIIAQKMGVNATVEENFDFHSSSLIDTLINKYIKQTTIQKDCFDVSFADNIWDAYQHIFACLLTIFMNTKNLKKMLQKKLLFL